MLALTDETGRVVVRTGGTGIIGDSQAGDDIIRQVLEDGRAVAETQILSHEVLAKEGILSNGLVQPASKSGPASGMVMKAAGPVLDDSGRLLGVLYGGRLLNGDDRIVDRVTDIIFKGEVYRGRTVGAVTIFQEGTRIATGLKGADGRRAIGTAVSEEVRAQVLEKGEPWVARARIFNEWYLTAYRPIRNGAGEAIGILGVGLIDKKYADLKRRTVLIFSGITLAGLAAALIIAYLLSNRIARPIHKLVSASRQVAEGHLDFRVDVDTGDEFGALGKAFNAMAAAVRERDERLKEETQEEVMKAERLAMIGRLASGVAHEINNPLGSILLFTRLLLQKAPAEGLHRENLERIERDTKRCQVIVQGLLDFARKREPKVESVDIHDVLDKTIRLFEGHPSFHGIEIVKTYQPDLPNVMVDSAHIHQVFVNIIMNAVDAMEGGGTLTITTQSSSNASSLEVSFRDTGCGIAPDALDRIFEPFYTTKAVGHGTGLGLSISYGIVEKHGGTIRVHSRVGEGSTFVVVLPKAREVIS
jgi:two-component system NtrC family sensor kinase